MRAPRGGGRPARRGDVVGQRACWDESAAYNDRMISRRTWAAALLGALVFLLVEIPCAVLASDPPQVLQPNESAYSTEEVTALHAALDELSAELSAPTYASQKTFRLTGWGKWTSAEFAAYTAGVLAGRGYETQVVSAAGWADGVHTWVVVAVAVGERAAWIPVEASPELGSQQLCLGSVPVRSDPAGALRFDEAYLKFDHAEVLAENRAPTARLRETTLVEVNTWVSFSADRSSDPDGSIVLYVWDFGDGTPTLSQTVRYARHRFAATGSYVVTVTVVDHRGATASTAMEVRAALDCGCG